MKKLLIASILISMSFYASSQNNTSFSFNYQHLHKQGNHRVGVGLKKQI